MGTLRDGEFETAAEMSSALREGDCSSVELVERALARAEAWQPSITAFSQLWGEEALEAARAIDRQPAEERGLLAGIPLAIKDLYDVAGHETTGCCAAYRGRIAEKDAPTVAAARASGMILIGKTNQHELAAGGTNLVSICGRTGNPWDPSRITGGSSGGSGAAVAAGIVPWAYGSDTGGSIRIPASMCGTFGLKPTYGHLLTDGMMPLAPSMDCPGPMALTAADLRALYLVMNNSPGRFDDPARRRLSWFRIAVPDGFFADRVHDQTLASVERVVGTFQEADVDIERVDGSGMKEARPTWMVLCSSEFAEAHPDLRGPRRGLVSPQPREWLEEGDAVRPDRRAAAERERGRITRWFTEQLEDFDALLVPTTPYPAFPADASRVELGKGGRVEVDRIGPGWLTSSVNLAGLPALNIPSGWSSDGLPIGTTLVGRPGDELRLLKLAEMWEAASAYRPKLPRQPRLERASSRREPSGGDPG
jgi:aspartyl-tRNA(Asn)/glutamyl-tRNA(Gln) amidotransferase subunit A